MEVTPVGTMLIAPFADGPRFPPVFTVSLAMPVTDVMENVVAMVSSPPFGGYQPYTCPNMDCVTHRHQFRAITLFGRVAAAGLNIADRPAAVD